MNPKKNRVRCPIGADSVNRCLFNRKSQASVWKEDMNSILRAIVRILLKCAVKILMYTHCVSYEYAGNEHFGHLLNEMALKY